MAGYPVRCPVNFERGKLRYESQQTRAPESFYRIESIFVKVIYAHYYHCRELIDFDL